MEVQIIVKPAFTVIGMEGSGPAAQGPDWIGPLWTQAARQIDEIAPFITGGGWGLMSAVDEYLARWTDSGKYLAGWEVRADTEPKAGWTIWQVPESTFAAIQCTLQTYGEALRYGNEVFLKSGEYEPAGAIHEYYPPEFKNPATDDFSLYFTVKKKTT